MNKIEIVNNKVISNIDDTIKLEIIETTAFFSVQKIVLKINLY